SPSRIFHQIGFARYVPDRASRARRPTRARCRKKSRRSPIRSAARRKTANPPAAPNARERGTPPAQAFLGWKAKATIAFCRRPVFGTWTTDRLAAASTQKSNFPLKRETPIQQEKSPCLPPR